MDRCQNTTGDDDDAGDGDDNDDDIKTCWTLVNG